jgi:hypothetical protein
MRNVIKREIPAGTVELCASLYVERRKLKTNSQIHLRIKLGGIFIRNKTRLQLNTYTARTCTKEATACYYTYVSYMTE